MLSPKTVYLLFPYKIFLILLIPLTTYTFQQTNTYLFKQYPFPYHLYIRNFHQSPNKKTTNLDNNINKTKIVTAIHTHHSHDSRTTKNCQFSSNNKSSFLPTSTHIRPPNTAIAHIWDNNIVSTSYPITKNQKIDHTLANRIIPNSFQHNTVDSTIILPSVVKKNINNKIRRHSSSK